MSPADDLWRHQTELGSVLRTLAEQKESGEKGLPERVGIEGKVAGEVPRIAKGREARVASALRRARGG
jgi:hypothetical protein